MLPLVLQALGNPSKSTPRSSPLRCSMCVLLAYACEDHRREAAAETRMLILESILLL